MNQIGKSQIKKTAIYLQRYLPLVCFCSSEQRTLQSGQILKNHLDIEIIKSQNLNERNWGAWSGKIWSEVEILLDQMDLSQRYSFTPPQGESWQQFENRLIKQIEVALAQSDNTNILFVTHSGVIRALMPFLLNKPRQESFKYLFDNASLSIFKIVDSNNFKVRTINYTDHLDKLMSAHKYTK